jgi:hypothetical protein
VIKGPLYKVVSCACARDKKLKDKMEWCEFCICRQCGGKNLPVDTVDGEEGDKRVRIYNDSSADLFLFIGLLVGAIGVVTYAGESLYKHLYVIGGVCLLFSLRDICVFFMITIS